MAQRTMGKPNNGLIKEKEKNCSKMTASYILVHAENSAIFKHHQKLPLAADADKFRLSAIYNRE